MNGKTIFALSRVAAALIAAVILLACTGWAFIDLLGGPAEITQGADLSEGAYVTTDVRFLMDICGVERDAETGEAVSYFAVVPVGDQFVIIRFMAEDYDTIAAFEAETQGYLSGVRSSLSFHMNVTGVGKTMDGTTGALLAEWFSNNAEWMSQSGLIAAVEDYSTYLCVNMIDTGSVGSVSAGAAMILSGIAAALAVYAVIEAVLILCGAYKRKGGANA